MEKALQSLGLGEKEQEIYKQILAHGKIAPALLSRLTKINRSTVYSVAGELKSKGLIIEDLGGKTLYYLPVPESGLGKIIEQEQEKLKKKKDALTELGSFLKAMPESKTYSVPKIRYIDGSDIKDYLYEATPRWIESGLAHHSTWWGFQDHTFVEKFKEWIVWFWKKAPKEVDLKLFSNKSEVEGDMVVENIARRKIRFWKGGDNFTGTQWVVGAYIILVVTKERPYYLVEIHDSVLSHNLRMVFQRLWDLNDESTG